jgi:hypothetical protein
MPDLISGTSADVSPLDISLPPSVLPDPSLLPPDTGGSTMPRLAFYAHAVAITALALFGVGREAQGDTPPGKVEKAAVGETVAWRTDYNKARKEARDKKLPLLILFRSPTCPWSAKLEREVETDKVTRQFLNQHFILLKLDGEQEPALSRALGIRAFPTLMMADCNGRIGGTLVGFRRANQLRQDLSKQLQLMTPAGQNVSVPR